MNALFSYAIVEDEQASLLMLKRLLKKLAPDGMLLWDADNGVLAHDKMLETPVDVLFLDIEFPPDNAFRFLERLKALGLKIPKIVFITGQSDYAISAFEWEACDYVLKPLTKERVKTSLDRVRLSLISGSFQTITENLDDVVWVLDRNLNLKYINSAIKNLTDFTPEEAMALPTECRYTPETVQKILDLHRDMMENPNVVTSDKLEVELYRKDGTTIWCEARFHPVWENGVLTRAYGTTTNITQRKSQELELIRLAITDQMTGAFNKAHFNSQITIEMARAKRYNRDLSLIMMDIDYFKMINDTYGHPVGDKALIAFAKAVHIQLRKTDSFYRVGGEEFCILLPEVSIEGALVFAERLRQNIASIVISVDMGQIKEDVRFTASFGCTTLNSEDHSYESLVRRADMALYKAKSSGRNRVSKNH